MSANIIVIYFTYKITICIVFIAYPCDIIYMFFMNNIHRRIIYYYPLINFIKINTIIQMQNIFLSSTWCDNCNHCNLYIKIYILRIISYFK